MSGPYLAHYYLVLNGHLYSVGGKIFFPHHTDLLTFEGIENYTLDDTPHPFEIKYYMSTTEGWIHVPPSPRHSYDVNCSIPTMEV